MTYKRLLFSLTSSNDMLKLKSLRLKSTSHFKSTINDDIERIFSNIFSEIFKILGIILNLCFDWVKQISTINLEGIYTLNQYFILPCKSQATNFLLNILLLFHLRNSLFQFPIIHALHIR